MARTLSGPYAIDRIEVPTFYTITHLKDCTHTDVEPGVTVFAQSSGHSSPDWITLGFVSRQTPLGQGISMGFERFRLQVAEPDMVRAALKRTHPHGWGFRPHCSEAADAGFQLVMAGAVRNWTNDSRGSLPPIIDVSRAQLERYAADTRRQHRAIMRSWLLTTLKQRNAIYRALKEVGTPAS
jgi:hypothetical protein